ncbi:MAG: glycosyltransferase family 2 protein [Aggregatilineales bacterium]
MADLAVVVVTWNVRALALEALRTLFADLEAHGPGAEVYAVDCASDDGTAEAIAATFPQVRLTASEENLGFARANNLALRQMGFAGQGSSALPRAVYLLNPDTLTRPGATRALFAALLEHSEVGLVGARLSYGDGTFQHSAFRFPGLRQLWMELFPAPARLYDSAFNGRYPRWLYDAGKPFFVDFVLGATMMLRREVIEQTGGFDEQFFMYCEEIDWAWRIQRAGWRVKCVPAAEVVHLAGQSTRQAQARSVLNLWASRLRLYDKHYPAWKAALARRMVAAGMASRAQKSRDPLLAEAYRAVEKLAQGRS